LIAGFLVIPFWPRIEPSAAVKRVPVEQPEFVAQRIVWTEKPGAPVARPIAKEAIHKLATALHAPTEEASPIVSLSMPNGDDARRLCAEGLVAFARGDIAAARAFLQRAAEAGDARALMALGDTYDPSTLARLGAVGIKGDEATARGYYSRALAAGVTGARERIAALASK